MKKGFTLVELSIVLVIIGLLIGGILVGQSLIDSAKINQAVRQIQQYDIAVSQFQNKFKQLPGDSDLMTPAGNNNGQLFGSTGETSCGLATCYEYMSFWKHLSDSKTLKGSYTNDYSSGEREAGVNSPEFLGAALVSTYSANDGTYFGPKGWSYSTYASFTYITLAAIESKTDDGNPNTGYVRSMEDGVLIPCGISHVEPCNISITIMSTNGQPLNQ